MEPDFASPTTSPSILLGGFCGLFPKGVKRSFGQDGKIAEAASNAIEGQARKRQLNMQLLNGIAQQDPRECLSALKKGASKNLKDAAGNTALSVGGANGSDELVEYCLNAGMKPFPQDLAQLAWKVSDRLKIKLIQGLDPRCSINDAGDTPLIHCMRNLYSTEVILACLDAGAETDPLTNGLDPFRFLLDLLGNNYMFYSQFNFARVFDAFVQKRTFSVTCYPAFFSAALKLCLTDLALSSGKHLQVDQMLEMMLSATKATRHHVRVQANILLRLFGERMKDDPLFEVWYWESSDDYNLSCYLTLLSKPITYGVPKGSIPRLLRLMLKGAKGAAFITYLLMNTKRAKQILGEVKKSLKRPLLKRSFFSDSEKRTLIKSLARYQLPEKARKGFRQIIEHSHSQLIFDCLLHLPFFPHAEFEELERKLPQMQPDLLVKQLCSGTGLNLLNDRMAFDEILLKQGPYEITLSQLDGLSPDEKVEAVSCLWVPQHLKGKVINPEFAHALLILLHGQTEFDLREGYEEMVKIGEKWIEDPEGFRIFVLLSLLIDQEYRERIYLALKSVSDETFLAILTQLFRNPDAAEEFNRKMCRLQTFSLTDGGRAKNTWEEFTFFILERLHRILQKNSSPIKKEYQKRIARSKVKETHPAPKGWLDSVYRQGYAMLRWQGRTLIFKKDDGELLAVKWLKGREDPTELHREFEVTSFLREYRKQLGLKSELPKPVGVWKMPKKVSDLYAQSPSVMTSWSPYAYVYTVPDESYFIYPHDQNLEDGEYASLIEKSMHDLGVLAREGILMTQLADLFHNTEGKDRDDQGRYLPLAGLLRPYFYSEGAGRLSAFWKAIEYPNIGLSGLRDLGDSETINDLTSKKHPVFSKLITPKRQRIYSIRSTLLEANTLGEYLMTAELLDGARAKLKGHLGCDRDDVEKTASLLPESSIALFSSVAKVSRIAAERFVCQNGVDWERYGDQMGYWMNNNSQGYLNGDFPDYRSDLFEGEAFLQRSDKVEQMRGCSREKGFAIDGKNPDLGTVNGPDPITEGVKNRHITIAYMLAVRQAQLHREELLKQAQEYPASRQDVLTRASHLAI